MSAILKTPTDPGLRSALYLLLAAALLILPAHARWLELLFVVYILVQPWLVGIPPYKLVVRLLPALWMMLLVGLPVIAKTLYHFYEPQLHPLPAGGLFILLKSILIIYLFTVLRLSMSGGQLFTLLHQWHIPLWLQSIIIFLNTLFFRLRLEFRRLRQGYESRVYHPGWRTRIRFMRGFSLVYFMRLILRSERNMQALFSRGFSGQWPVQKTNRPVLAEWLHAIVVSLLISGMLLEVMI